MKLPALRLRETMKEGITQSCAITSKEIFRCFFLFLLRVGSDGEKENGEKNRRAFVLGKGFGADAFAFWLLFAVFLFGGLTAA